jgi:hypothetical protein
MWIFTPFGFFSIVEDTTRLDHSFALVRARVEADMDAFIDRIDITSRARVLKDRPAILRNVGTDYRFRISVPKDVVRQVLDHFVFDELTYGNFKNEVADSQGEKRASLYHRVWETMMALASPRTLSDLREQKASSTAGRFSKRTR